MILQLIAAHRLFEQSRLRVRPVEHRRPRRFSVFARLPHVATDRISRKQRLILAVWSLVVPDLRPALPRRPQGFALAPDVVRDHRRCRLQNVLGRAVVLFQSHDFRFRKVALKLQNVANVGPAPRVDRLILISHRAHVVPIARQQPHQFVLRTVRVLIFIDQKILESPVVIFAHRRHRLEQPHGFEQQIVEIHRIRFPQLLAVLLENMRDALGLRIRRLQVDFLWIKHVILGPGNPREHVARRQLLVVQPQAPHDALDHLLLIALVVDDEIFREPDRRLPRHGRRNPQSFNVAPQHTHAKRVERRNHWLGNAQPADKFFNALHHLRRRLVGESHGKDRLRHHAHLLDQVSNAKRDDASLPAARPSQDQHRPVGSFDRLALLRI